jgi:hypothetical protein
MLFRYSLRCLNTTAAAAASGSAAKGNMKKFVHQYLEHLQPIPTEVVPLYDILPTEIDGTKAAYEFQAELIKELIETDSIVAWKVVAPTSEVVRPFKTVDGVCCPLFASTVTFGAPTGKLSLRSTRGTHIEMGMLLTIGRSDGVLRSVAPAIELSGSRWPYCAPHLPGYLADQCGHCRLVVGEEYKASAIPVTGAVLTRNNDPQLVGYARDGLGEALNYKRLISLCDKHMPSSEATAECIKILTPPWGGRVPAKAGLRYEANFGPYGKVSVDLEQ